MAATHKKTFKVCDYDLAATLASGQAFRWQMENGAWTGVIGGRWVRLRARENSITAETVAPPAGWRWLADYLQTKIDFAAVLKSFPADAPMRDAVAACRGLRLLRQEPWECLASFILSSTKQIVQIRQIIALLCERFGEPVISTQGPAVLCPPPSVTQRFRIDHDGAHGVSHPAGMFYSFPAPQKIASLNEADLRSCKMGFRAPYLLAAARAVAGGQLNLEKLRCLPVNTARAELLRLPGVGRKIADCVLLFGCGFDCAFPIDVWVMKALRQLYFPRRRVGLKRLEKFAATHFGTHAGYAQQYLFHYMRTKMK